MEQRERRHRTVLRLVLFLGILVGLTSWLTYASSHAYAPNADGATVVLEGFAATHGQLLLHGWSLSLDSFLTVDVPYYAVGVAVIGLAPILMHLIPALLLALCLLVGMKIGAEGAPLRQRVYMATLLLLFLAIPSRTGAYFLLQGPWHIATALVCLIAVVLLRRPGFGWRWFLSVVLIGLAINGDLQMVALGVVPLALAGLFASLRTRSLRAGLDLIGAAVAALVVALIFRAISSAVGTFSVSESHHTVKFHQLIRDLGHLGNWVTAIYGIHPGPVGGDPVETLLAIVRALVAIVVVFGVVTALVNVVRGLVRGDNRESAVATEALWRSDDLLLSMVLGALGVFLLLTLSNNTSYARYLDPVVIFSSILAARIVARALVRFSNYAEQMAAPLLVATLIVLAYSSAVVAGRGAPTAPTAPLERYLISHHLTKGIADYWAASIVTVDTRGAVVLRPVVANLQGIVVPDGRQASASWYDHVTFDVVVYQRDPYGRVDAATVRRTFGAPAATRTIGTYSVLTYRHPIVVHGPAFP